MSIIFSILIYPNIFLPVDIDVRSETAACGKIHLVYARWNFYLCRHRSGGRQRCQDAQEGPELFEFQHVEILTTGPLWFYAVRGARFQHCALNYEFSLAILSKRSFWTPTAHEKEFCSQPRVA